MLEDAVVGDVVAGRLAHALVALATEGEDVDAQLFLHLPGHGVDVVADEADRAGGEDADGLGLEECRRPPGSPARSFFSPPKMICSSCMSVEKQ